MVLMDYFLGQVKIEYMLDNPGIVAELRKNIGNVKTIRENAEEIACLYDNFLRNHQSKGVMT
jgi:hypothetical protein